MRKVAQNSRKSEKIESFSKEQLKFPVRIRVMVNVGFRVKFPPASLGFIKILEKRKNPAKNCKFIEKIAEIPPTGLGFRLGLGLELPKSRLGLGLIKVHKNTRKCEKSTKNREFFEKKAEISPA